MKIFFIGDIVGKAGRTILTEKLPRFLDSMKIDLCVANAENAAGGFGITREIGGQLLQTGIDVLTSGNHIWDKKEAIKYITEERCLLRPANYPPFVPGKGADLFEANGIKVGIINLAGRVYMPTLDCPFRAAEREIAAINSKTNVILIDMHAEATSEKIAMGWYLDGKVSAIIGTHTHVQTADEKILPGGTAYLTDAGMTGPVDSVIGVKKELALHRFITQMPKKFETAGGKGQIEGVIIEIDSSSGKARAITRIRLTN